MHYFQRTKNPIPPVETSQMRANMKNFAIIIGKIDPVTHSRSLVKKYHQATSSWYEQPTFMSTSIEVFTAANHASAYESLFVRRAYLIKYS